MNMNVPLSPERISHVESTLEVPEITSGINVIVKKRNGRYALAYKDRASRAALDEIPQLLFRQLELNSGSFRTEPFMRVLRQKGYKISESSIPGFKGDYWIQINPEKRIIEGDLPGDLPYSARATLDRLQKHFNYRAFRESKLAPLDSA